jgi:type 1 fimbria pilin
MTHHYMPASRHLRLLALLLLGLIAMGKVPDARAAPTCSGGNLVLNLPNVTVTRDTPVGALLGSPISGQASFSCSGGPSGSSNPKNRFAIQIYDLQANQLTPQTLPSPGSTNINTMTFATGLSGIGLQLTINPAMRGYDVNPGDQQPGAYIVGYINGTSGGLTVSYTAQLVVTGAVTPGTISAKTLLNYEWYVYGYNNSASLGTHLTLNSGTQVGLRGCTVNADSQNFTVTLPTVGITDFTDTGSTAGLTAFHINLSCQAGTTMSITMDTASRASQTGVVKPTSGSNNAKNIGVQVLDGSQAAVTFGQATKLGASPDGPLSLPYYARYYQTGRRAGAGKVSATVTFTMSYQ